MSFFKKVSNIFRAKAIAAEKAIADPKADATIAIVDSKKQAAGLQKNISEFNANNKLQERRLKDKKEAAKKFGSMAERAVEAGDDAAATTLLEKQEIAEKEVKGLNAIITGNNKEIASARKQLSAMTSKIQNAESNKDRLELQMESAKIRHGLAAARSNINKGSNPLASLDALENAVDEMEAKADATEEEVGLEPENVEAELAEKYGEGASSSSKVGDKLAAMKAAAAKKAKKSKAKT